jgi:hypothetical protein
MRWTVCVRKCGALCWEASGAEIVAPDSIDWPDSNRSLDCADSDTHRFRTQRQLWADGGLALQTFARGEYRFVQGQLRS